MIVKWNLSTPGREADEDEVKVVSGKNDATFATYAQTILEALGGKDNIVSVDNCITRMRLEVKDNSIIDEAKIKATGAKGVLKPSKNGVQIIIGTQVQFVTDEFRKLVE